VGEFGTGSRALAFTNDGKMLLAPMSNSGPDNQRATLALFDARTGAHIGFVAGPFPNGRLADNFARDVALDRRHAAAAVIVQEHPGSPVTIYDMRDWSLKGMVVVENDTPRAIAFGPDGKLAVGTISGVVAVFDPQTKQLVDKFAASPSVASSLAYSPDGQSIAVGTALSELFA
jgi:WD40 repeat protein